MALKDKVLEDFFSKSHVTPISRALTKNFRVFDDPDHSREKNFENNNLGQIKDKQETNLGQTQGEIRTNISQIEDIPQTEPRSTERQNADKPKTNLGQKNHLTYTINYYSLVGLQKKIILFIYDAYKNLRERATKPISIEVLSSECNTTKQSAQKTIQRLEQKGIIIRTEHKAGRGGWTRYELSDQMHNEIYQEESRGAFLRLDNQQSFNLAENLGQTKDFLETENRTQLRTTALSSSSLNQTTTITSKPEKTSLPIEWQEIDFEPLEKIRFHKGHVEQLFKHGLELQPVQESIYHFAFDLTANNKGKDIKTDPLGFFMGIMKRSGYYAAPENYESPQEQGRRLFLEQEVKKAQKKLQAEKELMMSYFELWVNQFTEQEKIDLVGKTELGPNRTMLTTEHKLVMHYKNTIWPEQYKKMLAGVS